MQLPQDGDVAARVMESGGVDLYLQHVVHDTKSLRSVAALAAAVGAQQESLRTSRDAGAASLRAAATQAVRDVRARLADIEGGAAATLSEYDTRRARLAHYAHAFRERAVAASEHAAVVQCRAIAEAYAAALAPLARLQVRGDRAALGEVAVAITRLVDAVDAVRASVDSGVLSADGDESKGKLSPMVLSLENRTVDAVIKARAAFVNILDNEFRSFGWPMKVPTPERDANVVATVNFFVTQLDALQKSAQKSDFILSRTHWQRALSDSWAGACILRAPLDRFKYHFLESFRADLSTEDTEDASDGTSVRTNGSMDDQRNTTSRFDRPEWAADFAVERIQEATPFLREIAMDGPQSAEIKFIKGFCRVFADKIAYDCELAIRSSKNDSDADSLISHAADIARQFDNKLRSGALDNRGNKLDEEAVSRFPSALALLSSNTVFFTDWASSELRLAETQVSKRLDKILSVKSGTSSTHEFGIPNGNPISDLPQALDIEAECGELLHMVGEAGAGCHQLNEPDLIANFLRLTELPLLQMVRARLRKTMDDCDWAPKTFVPMFTCARASWCTHVLSELLDDRVLEPFYAKFENIHGYSLFAEEIERLKSFTERATNSISGAAVDNFVTHIKESYLHQVRFGELASQDAAVVLAHDLSEPLCKAMTQLEDCLRALNESIASRKISSSIWRSIANKLDAFFFDEVVMQAFAGGMRNTVVAASASNAYLKPRTAAKMARQIAFDAIALVSVFEQVSSAPRNFLPRCAEAAPLLRMASARVMRPNIAAKQGHAEAVEAVLRLAGEISEDDERIARDALEEVFGVTSVSPRECLELFAIAGLHSAIPLS